MRKLLLCFILAFGAFTAAFSQNRQVTGRVISDSAGEVLNGVTVTLKGTSTVTTTDAEGKFTITVPNLNSVLVFSSVGYSSREINVGNKTNLDVRLVSQINTLNDVVVVGYQSVRRRDLTASVSSIGAKQLKDIPLNSAAQALAGQLAGVQVTGSEGSPNADVQIRIRGGGSITQDNSPLYIIDGAEVENGLSAISPQDIESVVVLKDASATSIYGARGANGVVIITTKRGRVGRTTISYNGFMGIRKLENKLSVMKPYEFVIYQYERSRGNATDSSNFANHYGTTWDTLSNYKNVPFLDWQEQMFGRSALMQTHNVSLNGGNTSTQYNLSLTSNTEQGIMQNSDFDRKLASFSFDHNFNSKLKISFTTRFNNTNVNGAGTSNPGSSAVNGLRQSVRYIPFFLPGQTFNTYDPNYAAETNSNSLALVNPLLLNSAQYRNNVSTLLNLTGSLNYSFTPYLSFKTTFGYDYNAIRQNAFDDTITYNAKANGSGLPIASIQTSTRGTITNSNVLTYTNSRSNTDFAQKNAIDVLVGHEVYQNIYKSYYEETRMYPAGITYDRALGNMGLGIPAPSSSNDYTERLLSFFGRINYAFDHKYLASVSLRTDGSSKFAPGNQWGYFPSGSVAWRISNESFMESLKPTISDLKLRFSYGEAGNNRIGNFLFSTQFVPNTFYGLNDVLVSAFNPQSLSNPALKWESTISRNLGLDVSFFNNRISISGDIYQNTTKNLLVNVTIPTTSGYTTQLQNVGSTENRGLELQLSGTILQKRNFTWTANFNVSFNRNKVLSLGEHQSFFLVNSGWAVSGNPADYIVKVGEPVGSMWGLVADGYYTLNDFNYDANTRIYTLRQGLPNASSVTSFIPAPGGIKFKDLNGDGIINDKDRTIIGNANPFSFGGLNQQFTYKNFDASIFINFVYGNQVFNANKLEFASGYTPEANLLSIMNNRWHTIDPATGQVIQQVITINGTQQVVGASPDVLAKVNSGATLWTPLTSSSAFYPNSWGVEDGSFIRINNITIGYTLPASITNRLRIQRLRIYVTGNNLAVITGYSGYDPEVNTRRGTPMTPGVDYSAYPRSRSFLAGINLSF